MNKFHTTTDGNQAFILGFTSPPPAHAPVVLTMLFHNGSEEEAKAFFADLFELGPIANMTSMIPYEKLNGLMNGAATYGGRKLSGGGAYKLPIDPQSVSKLYTDYTEFVSSHENMEESIMLWETIPYKKLFEVPNKSMSFSNRGDYYNVAVLFKW